MKKLAYYKEQFPKFVFICSACFLIFLFGFISSHYGIFPYRIITKAIEYAEKIKDQGPGGRKWYYHETDLSHNVQVYNQNKACNGVTLFSSLDADNALAVTVIDMDGNIIHKWSIDWFEIWPDATHIPEPEVPKERPGTHVHGVVLLDNGDIVFNFEHLGLIRMDPCGNVVWKLSNRTHHSIYLDENKELWVCSQIDIKKHSIDYPNIMDGTIKSTILKVSLDGEILKEIDMFDVLTKNNLEGYLYMSSIGNEKTQVSGDLLHINDVETFPPDMQEGFFKTGDILVSFRNVNTVLVMDQECNIKFIKTGAFIRQHDPDFVDGNTISVFDNNNRALPEYNPQSRILLLDALTGETSIYFTGTKEHPFYTHIMGKHQWLENGNLLITESLKGHAFEVAPDGEIVWDFYNIAKPGVIGIVQQADRLSKKFDKDFFAKRMQECEGK